MNTHIQSIVWQTRATREERGAPALEIAFRRLSVGRSVVWSAVVVEAKSL